MPVTAVMMDSSTVDRLVALKAGHWAVLMVGWKVHLMALATEPQMADQSGALKVGH